MSPPNTIPSSSRTPFKRHSIEQTTGCGQEVHDTTRPCQFVGRTAAGQKPAQGPVVLSQFGNPVVAPMIAPRTGK